MAHKIIECGQLTPAIQNFDNAAIINNLNRLCNQIFKLLPLREEEKDYVKPLETAYIELLGLSSLLEPEQDELLSLVCKLKGLHSAGNDIEFALYRRTIFECCGLISDIKNKL